MTYEGIFEKCKTTAEVHKLHKELIAKCNSDIGRWDCDNAYFKRLKEIRKEREEHCYG